MFKFQVANNLNETKIFNENELFSEIEEMFFKVQEMDGIIGFLSPETNYVGDIVTDKCNFYGIDGKIYEIYSGLDRKNKPIFYRYIEKYSDFSKSQSVSFKKANIDDLELRENIEIVANLAKEKFFISLEIIKLKEKEKYIENKFSEKYDDMAEIFNNSISKEKFEEELQKAYFVQVQKKSDAEALLMNWSKGDIRTTQLNGYKISVITKGKKIEEIILSKKVFYGQDYELHSSGILIKHPDGSYHIRHSMYEWTPFSPFRRKNFHLFDNTHERAYVTSNYSFQKEVNHHSDTTNKTAIDAYITHSIFVQPGPRDFKIDRCNIEYLSEILADITIV